MKALISGYYGFGNAGDELILRSLIRELRSSRPGMHIAVLSSDPEKTARMCDVEAVARWNPISVLRALLSSDVLVSGGGGLFQDRTGNLSLYYYLLLICIAALLRKRNILYCVGVNGVRRMNASLTGRIINAADIVTVRDEGSRRLLAAWGVAADRIKVTADPVLLYGELRRHAPCDGPVIAFILRPAGGKEGAAAAIARAAGEVRAKLGATIVFIPFQKDADLPFTETVAALTGPGTVIAGWQDPGDVLRLIEGVDMVVSQRFHGLVLAVLAGIPPVGISADQKIQRFMAEIGRPCFPRFEETDALAGCIIESWQQRDRIGRDMAKMRRELIERARETAEVIGRVLPE